MENKLESNFKNMVLVLLTVTLGIAASVSYVFALTQGPIELVKQEQEADAIRQVVPSFDNNPSADAWRVAVSEGESDNYDYLYTNQEPDSLILYPAKRDGELVGTAVKTFSNNGFGGQVWVMVGFKPDGAVYGYSVLEHHETPGLGTEMIDWFSQTGPGNIIGKNPSVKNLQVKKDGGDVDAITAATISSKAFLDAVNRASAAVSGSVDSYSGATKKVQN
ncbi:electron transport complex subunit G [Bacteroidia bacterium]|nr:electron transport complex subunit G [Bacteroidia bacterium]